MWLFYLISENTLYFEHFLQWRVQDFPEGAPTPEGGVNLLFGIIFAENVKMHPSAHPVDPPLQNPHAYFVPDLF